MEQMHDVVISGGGLNGPALAVALAQAGLKVALVDATPARARQGAAFDGRAYALALASVRALEAMGVWGELASHAQPIRKVVAQQSRPGEAPGSLGLFFDAAEIEEGVLGQMLEDRYLSRALWDAMAAHGVETRTGCAIVAQETAPGHIHVQTDTGEAFRTRLLVGADGRASGVAARAGIKRTGWDYGQTALVAALDHDRPHEGVARQIFLPTGPLAALPLCGNRSSIVWSCKAAEARRIAALGDEAFLHVLSDRLAGCLGEIALAGPRFSYKLSLTLANSYIAERVALIGDAAHGVHPIAGQGLNLGLRDVAALAETLVDAHRRGEDLGAAPSLARYQGWRRFDSTLLAAGMDGVNSLFSNSDPVLRGVRAAGMGVVNAIPGLRRRFMRQAAGLTLSPMPRLLAGRAL